MENFSKVPMTSAQRSARHRASRTLAQQQLIRDRNSIAHADSRASQSADAKQEVRLADNVRHADYRASQSADDKQEVRLANNEQHAISREARSDEEHAQFNLNRREQNHPQGRLVANMPEFMLGVKDSFLNSHEHSVHAAQALYYARTNIWSFADYRDRDFNALRDRDIDTGSNIVYRYIILMFKLYR